MNDKRPSYYDGYNKDDYNKKSKLARAMNVYEKEGILAVLKKIFTFSFYKINYAIFNRYFIVDGKKYYRYFINLYNAVISERVIEIPFANEFLVNSQTKCILEIGNVLSHYFDINHAVVDKYEKGLGIINVDVLDLNPDKRYDLIIAISTIEHVGFDEPVKENGKSKKTVQKIIDLLDNKGIAVITVPLGYNPEIDSIIEHNEIDFTRRYFLKRVSRFNLWKETTMEDAIKCKYGSKYPAANSVAFLLYQKE